MAEKKAQPKVPAKAVAAAKKPRAAENDNQAGVAEKPVTEVKHDQYQMSEEEFADEVRQSLLILATSSPDKREIYRDLFLNHDKNPSKPGEAGFEQTPHSEHHKAGLNCHFIDSGALRLAPRKTPEKTGFYGGNLDEKLKQQMALLSDPEIQRRIRNEMKAARGNVFDPNTVNIMGMTEDSGMQLIFDADKDFKYEYDIKGHRQNCGPVEKMFIDSIVEKLEQRVRPEDHTYIDKEKLYKTGFPGPNFKPLQERLQGGFGEMMDLIYDTVRDVNKQLEATHPKKTDMRIDDLRFSQTVNVSFVSPRTGKYFKVKPFVGTGRLLNEEEYDQKFLGTKRTKAVSINSVQVFDGQEPGKEKSVDQLVEMGLHQLSSEKLPAMYPRRELTEWLQGLVGKRRSKKVERDRFVQVAYVDADDYDGDPKREENPVPRVNDVYSNARIPTRMELLKNPHKNTLGDVDAVVVMPVDENAPDGHLYPARNLGLLQKLVIDTETIPEAMRVPIIIDNRSGKFTAALEVFSDATMTGRFPALQDPFMVVNPGESLKPKLEYVKDLVQRSPVMDKADLGDVQAKSKVLEKVPNDGTFTVFIGGGHANNTADDLKEAENVGYYCAQHGYRIITGGGSIEGSMGAVHTGFIKYHLEQLEKSDDPAAKPFLSALSSEEFRKKDGSLDVEKVIEEKRLMLDEMAEKKLIPADMFYAYSMKPLLEMESPIRNEKGEPGMPPPGVNYIDAGNRVRRLTGLLASGTKVFMRGGIGTDEEFEETVRQHLESRQHKLEGNGDKGFQHFSDGTASDDGTMIIMNKEHHLDKLLEHYHLSGHTDQAKRTRSAYKVIIVNNEKDLHNALGEREKSWTEAITRRKHLGEIAVTESLAK